MGYRHKQEMPNNTQESSYMSYTIFHSPQRKYIYTQMKGIKRKKKNRKARIRSISHKIHNDVGGGMYQNPWHIPKRKERGGKSK